MDGMMTRRDFVRLSAAAAAAGCTLRASSAFAGTHDGMTYGVQLYMVRKEAPADLAGVLKKIRQTGFEQVELYPIAYTHTAADLKKMIEDAGLGHDSAHFDFDSIPARIGYAKELGLKYMVISILPPKYWGVAGGFKSAAYLMNQWGKLIDNADMKLVFHNHNYEFKVLPDGETGFEILMKNTDSDLVKLELDPDPLTFGLPRETAAFCSFNPAFEVASAGASPLGGAATARIVGRFAKSNVLMSGWLEGERAIAGKGAVVEVKSGQGRAVLFGFRPQHRGQSHATFRLFFNAIHTSG